MRSNERRDIRSFEDVERILGNREQRKVGHNTYLIRRGPGEIALRLHSTDILTFTPDRVIYDTDGWRTVTTKARMNAWGPLYISQHDWEWYVGVNNPYYDGIAASYQGRVIHSLGLVAD